MTQAERKQLRDLVKRNPPYQTARWLLSQGRITSEVFRRFVRLWTWGAFRLSGTSYVEQDTWEKKYGKSSWERIRRVTRLIDGMRTITPKEI